MQYPLNTFLSPPYNFSDFQTFSHQNLHYLQPVRLRAIGIGNLKGWFLQIGLSEKLYGLYRHCRISKEEGAWNWFWYKSWKSAPYNDTKNSFYPKCHLFAVLWFHIVLDICTNSVANPTCCRGQGERPSLIIFTISVFHFLAE